MGIEIGEVISSNNDKVKIKLSSDISIGDGIRIIGEKEDTGLVITKIFVNHPLQMHIKMILLK